MEAKDLAGDIYVDPETYDLIDLFSYGGFLVVIEEQLVLFEDGLGTIDPVFEVEVQAAGLEADLASLGYTRDDVDYVIHSHLHRDHTGWNTYGDITDPTIEFPNALHIIQQAEYDYYSSTIELKEDCNWDVVIQPLVDSGQIQIADGAQTLVSSEDGLTRISVLNCSGHTVGHQCAELSSNDGYILFAG